MLFNLFNSSIISQPLSWILLQKLNYNILCLSRHFPFLFSNGRPLNLRVLNILIHLKSIGSIKWRDRNQHLIYDNPNTPPVTHFSWSFSQQNFWRDVIRCPLYTKFILSSSSFFLFPVDECSESKICQFEMTLIV